MEELTLVTTILLVGGIVVFFFIIWAVPVLLWIEALFAGVKIGITSLIGMRLRKVSPPPWSAPSSGRPRRGWS